MNSNKIFRQHREIAQLLSAMFNHKGTITIKAGSLRYTLRPGSLHYEQVKFLLSEFGCDHIAAKHKAEMKA